MYLNQIKGESTARAKRKRVGRGIGSGTGKTCGRGHKGQKSRSGGYHKVGFEGGQMALQRRLPKRGFRSMTRADCAQVRLHELNRIDVKVIDLAVLRDHRIIGRAAKRAKVIVSGDLIKPVTLKGIRATKGAEDLIQKAGGKVTV